jgi:hypothetical protein
MTGRAGKTRNIFLVWLIWPLITLGIYHFVWWYKINREARDFDDNIKVEPMLSLLAILIGWVIIVPPFVSIYRTGDRIGKMQDDAGMDVSCSGLLGLVLSFLAGLHSLYYQYELNRIWARLGNPQEGSLVALPVAAVAPAAAPASPAPAAPASPAPAEPASQPQAEPASQPQAARSGGTGLRAADEPSKTNQDDGESPTGG